MGSFTTLGPGMREKKFLVCKRTAIKRFQQGLMICIAKDLRLKFSRGVIRFLSWPSGKIQSQKVFTYTPKMVNINLKFETRSKRFKPSNCTLICQ